MTELERRALLGDRQAQEECTQQGIVLPCPCCKGNSRVRYTGNNSGQYGYTSNVYSRSKPGFIMCDKCGLQSHKMMRVCRALAKWNARPVPPIGKCKDCGNTCESEGEGYVVCLMYGCPVKNDNSCIQWEPKEE